MKLSKLVARAQALLEEEGDLDVLSVEGYALHDLIVDVAKDLPADWDMPDGTKYVTADDMR